MNKKVVGMLIIGASLIAVIGVAINSFSDIFNGKSKNDMFKPSDINKEEFDTNRLDIDINQSNPIVEEKEDEEPESFYEDGKLLSDSYNVDIVNFRKLLEYGDLTENALEMVGEMIINGILAKDNQDAILEIDESTINLEFKNEVNTVSFVLRDYYTKKDKYSCWFDFGGFFGVETV